MNLYLNISYPIRRDPTGKLWMTVGDRWQYTARGKRQKFAATDWPCVGFTDCLHSWQHNRWCAFPKTEEASA